VAFMIGIIARLLGVEGAGLGACAVCALFASAFCCCWCAKGGCRACACGKRCLRCIGWDSYRDSEVYFVVRKATFFSVDNVDTCVRLTAGSHSVQTHGDPSGTFFEVLSLFVEQGTQDVEVALLQHRSGTVLASIRLDVAKDIFEPCRGSDLFKDKDMPVNRTLFLKPVQNGVLKPKVEVSIQLQSDMGGGGALQQMDMAGLSPETQLLVKMQFAAPTGQEPTSEMEAFLLAFAGPVEEAGMFGWNTSAYVGVLGPPKMKKYTLCKWGSKEEGHDGRPPKFEINVLRIVGVQPDPRSPKGFIINAIQADKSKLMMQLIATDRSRDVWVELLSRIIDRIRQQKLQQEIDI